MAILLDFTILAPGGATTYAHGFLAALARRKFESDVLVLLPHGDLCAPEALALAEAGYAVIRLKMEIPGSLRSQIRRQLVVPAVALRRRTSVIFCPRDAGPIILRRRVVILARNKWAWADLPGAESTILAVRILRWNAAYSAKWAKHVLSVSAHLGALIPAKDVAVVPHGCDVPETWLERADRTSDRPVRLLALGSVFVHKRLEVVIKIAHEMCAGGTAVRLRIVGTHVDLRETERLRTLSRDLLGYDALVGPAALDKRQVHLTWADVLVISSSFESFGMAMVEAMRVGAVVVAPKSPMAEEICGEAAVLYREGDPLDGARAIMEGLEGADALRRLGGVRSQRFSWDGCVDSTMDVLMTAKPEAFSASKRR